jgi:hypothetical protein
MLVVVMHTEMLTRNLLENDKLQDIEGGGKINAGLRRDVRVEDIISTHGACQTEICVEDVEPCSLVRVDRRFRGAYCLHHQGDSSPSPSPSHL